MSSEIIVRELREAPCERGIKTLDKQMKVMAGKKND